jgi:hypothetical protein
MGIWKINIPSIGGQLVVADSAWKAVELALAETRMYESGYKLQAEFVGWVNFWDVDVLSRCIPRS